MLNAKRFFANSSGATSVEYSFLVCLLALAAMGGMSLAGNALASTLMISANTMTSAPAIAGKS